MLDTTVVHRLPIPGIGAIYDIMSALGQADIPEIMAKFTVVEPYEHLVELAIATTYGESHQKLKPVAQQLADAAEQWLKWSKLPPADAVSTAAQCILFWTFESSWHENYSARWQKSYNASRAAIAWIYLQRALRLEEEYITGSLLYLDRARFIRRLEKYQNSAGDLSNRCYKHQAPEHWQNMANQAHREISKLIETHSKPQRPSLRLVS